ncbi:MAG: DNA repair protein RadC [Chloroflexi bacterium]|nr:DNA repair protein RadC [Ktedonobacteraceae bacterium]MBV9021930.1 DNA repair protein RadC [Ktedonobacteraceae bacterium]MBV9707819.1 DNA repair protein RadC [Chloroflexota bacterium]
MISTNTSITTRAPLREQSSLEKPEYHATVHDMPVNDRPRERLQRYGVDSLSNAELLAIVLRTGTMRENVMQLAAKLLSKYSGLGGLTSAGFHELCTEYGLGMAKTSQLKAALELGKRLSMEQPDKKFQVRSADDAASLVRMELMYLDHEEMYVLILDTKHQVVEKIKSYKGTVNSSVLRGAEVFRPAVVRNCPSVIVCHNHPSGDPTPSHEDMDVTNQLIQAGKVLDIELLDHIIIGNPKYVSLKECMNW